MELTGTIHGISLPIQTVVVPVTESRIGHVVDTTRITLNIVVDAVGQVGDRAVLVLFIPVKTSGAFMGDGFAIMTEIVLFAVKVVGMVDHILRVIVQRTLAPVAVSSCRGRALFQLLVVVQTWSTLLFHGLSGKALDELVT